MEKAHCQRVSQAHGIQTFSDPRWKSLPSLLECYAKSGWYQGSVFFLISGTSLSPFPASSFAPLGSSLAFLYYSH